MTQAKTMRRMGIVLLAAVLASCGTPHPGQDKAGADTMAPRAAAQTVARQTIGEGLYELAYSPSQNAVFVAAAGRFGPGSTGSHIYRLHPETLAVQEKIALPHPGFGMALDEAAGRLYIGHSTEAAVTVIDTRTHVIEKTIRLAEKRKAPDGKERYPHNFRELVVDRASKRLYLAGMSMQDSALYVVNTDSLALETVVPGLGPMATGITLDAAGQRLFVSNLAGQIHALDTPTLRIVGQWESGADQPLNLAYDARRSLVYAVDQSMPEIHKARKELDPAFTPRAQANDVVIIDPATRQVVGTMPAGNGPVALLVDAQRDRLYVTSRASGSVSVFDLKTRQTLHTFALGQHPNSLALDPASGAVFVSIKHPFVKGGTVIDEVARLSLP